MEALKKTLKSRTASLRTQVEAIQNAIAAGLTEVKRLELQRDILRAKIEEIERIIKETEDTNEKTPKLVFTDQLKQRARRLVVRP